MKTNLKYVALFFLLCGLCACNKEVTTIGLDVDCSQSDQITLDNGLVFVKDGNVYRQGDMLYSSSEVKGVFTRNSILYWPEGVVYYDFAPNCTNRLIQNAMAAMEELSDSTCVQFLPADSSTTNYIRFKLSSGNNSYLGMKGGMQVINIYNDDNVYIIMHEICHALGIYHEQNRSDRDEYIHINMGNVRKEVANNFTPVSDGYNIGPFNYESIMLYPQYIYDLSFVYNVYTPVITRLDGLDYIYNRGYLSQGDVKTVKAIYGRHAYAKLIEEIEIYQDIVAGADELYDANHEWFVAFYSNPGCTIPTTCESPCHIHLRKDSRHVDNNGHVVTTTSYEDAYIPAGTSRILIRSNRNKECYYYSNPTVIDYVIYRIQYTE